MAEVTLNVEVRENTGKGPGRRLRQTGKIPGILYGKSVEVQKLQVDASSVQRLIQSGAAGGLIHLKVGDSTQVVLLKDVQTDPVRGELLHVDFHAVALDQDVQVEVPIVIVGEDVRPNDGGIVSQSLRDLPISCLPTVIPESVSVDISELAAGETVTVGDIELPEGVTARAEEDEVVLSIVVPRQADEEEETEAGEEAAEGAAEDDSADSEGASESDE